MVEETVEATANDDSQIDLEKELQAEAERSAPQEPDKNLITLYSKTIEYDDFKCWIRIPNKLQHRKMQKAAQAARARKVAEYKNPDSDASAVLQTAIDEVSRKGRDGIVEWLVDQHVREKALEAYLVVESQEEFENIDEHREAYNLLHRQGSTDSEEFKIAQEFIIKASDAIRDKTNELLEPFVDKYEAMDEDALREKVKRALIKADADDEFMNEYNVQMIFYGTRLYNDHEKHYFKTLDDLYDAPDGVVELLTQEFSMLDALKAGELKKAVSQMSL